MASEKIEAFNARVSGDLFGANLLFDRDRLGTSGTFDDVVMSASVTNIRYPGGTISERYFNLREPDRTTATDAETGRSVDLLPLSEFLDWAGSARLGVSIVIPTDSLLTGPLGSRAPVSDAYAVVHKFVSDLLSGKYGSADIECLEIGNEYWLGGRQNQVEYARIADIVARASQNAIDAYKPGAGTGWSEPSISVQVGQYGRYATDPGWQQDSYIRNALSDEAAAAVDGVVAHYYTRGTFADLEKHEYYFDRLDAWGNDPRYRGIEYHVTEWNTDHLLSQETGLGQVATMAWMVSEMVAEGVDSAFVWPLQQNTRNDLSGKDGQSALTLAGETFRLMADLLPGTHLTSRRQTDNCVTYIYEGKYETVVVASATGTNNHRLTLNLADFGYDAANVTIHLVDAAGDRLGPGAIAALSEQTLAVEDTFNFRLFGHQTVFLEIQRAPEGGESILAPLAQHVGSAGNDLIQIGKMDSAGRPVFAGHVDGGSGTDTLDLPGTVGDYSIYSHGDRLVFRKSDLDEEHKDGRMIATTTSVETFEGIDLTDLTILDGFAHHARSTHNVAATRLSEIRDFDGNDLGAGANWRAVGVADIQFDGDAERIFVNPVLGRWATVGPGANGAVDFSDFGQDGETRVVGIYVDPLVAAGRVQKGSAHDSQSRFENDRRSNNLTVVDAFDFDSDGHQEIYFRLKDGSAYLRGLMHSDGNINYANYQSENQVEAYLAGLGYDADVVDAILI